MPACSGSCSSAFRPAPSPALSWRHSFPSGSACAGPAYEVELKGQTFTVDLALTPEEQRLTDGDPHVKAKIRRVQQDLANRRMMDDVPDATVVVTNPTHYAVALRYEREESNGAAKAPVVVAKGVDSLAQRIKKVAKANDVICYEDVPLARSLYAQCEIGDEIPEELYAAVAVVLGYVYGLRGKAPTMAVGA